MKKPLSLLLSLLLIMSLCASATAEMTLAPWPDTSVMPERNAENPTFPSVTGYFQYTLTLADGSERAVYEYVAEEMGPKRPTVLIAGPNGANSLTFLEESGWKALADQYKFDIIYCEAKDGVWGAPENEDAYIDAALAYSKSNMIYRHGGQCAFYVIGYGEGADVMLYQALTFPQMYAGAAFLGVNEIDENLLKQLKTTPSVEPSVMIADVPLPVWIAASEKTAKVDALVDYFVAANDCSDSETLIYKDKYADALYHPLGWLAKTNEITDAAVSNVYVNYSDMDVYDQGFVQYLWGDVLRHVQWAPAYTNLRAMRYWAEPEELGYVRETVEVDGVNREMYIYVPERLKDAADGTIPMVICFHGMNVNGSESAVRYGWYKVAEERGFIAVCPTGSQQATSFPTNFMWNYATDVPFVNALIDQMIERYPVDATRVYATGSSNGSMMAMWLQAAMPERIAATASYDMVMALNAVPVANENLKIAMLAISGSSDPAYGSKWKRARPPTTTRRWKRTSSNACR